MKTPKDVDMKIVAIGAHGFGFGDSVKEAVDNCRPNCYRPCEYFVHYVHTSTRIGEIDGALIRDKGTPEPVLIAKGKFRR